MLLATRSPAAVGARRIAWPLAAGIALAITAGIALGGCSKQEKVSKATSAGAASSLPASFALASEPAGAKPVKELVASAKSGDEVAALGRVGEAGSTSAFFTLVDTSIMACTEMADPCPTPWDYCCEPPEEMAKASATVEFRDGDKPLATSVLGFNGLDHLSTVVVKGKAVKDSVGNITIVASGIWVKPRS